MVIMVIGLTVKDRINFIRHLNDGRQFILVCNSVVVLTVDYLTSLNIYY